MSGINAGHSVQVVSVEPDGTYRVDEEAVRRVVNREEVRGLPVSVVSVAGATRGGKSFLLDFFLRYLHAPELARATGTWIGPDDEPLKGFSWRGGSERDTTGILLWSEPIIVTQDVNGRTRKIAVLLMDTQGTFDNTSTVKDCTTIFAMSTLLSSNQIYNLAQIIKEDDLQHLQLFTEYGKLACSASESKPFQSLVFRVRDWMSPYELSYGAEGGQKYLKSVLDIKENQKQELRELRQHIHDSFESISCVLMPHPGLVVSDKNFSGRICDLQIEFVMSLLEFVPLIFGPTNIIAKMVNGQEIKTGDIATYFRSYMGIFNSNDLPTPVSILKATGEASLEVAVTGARAAYTGSMQRECSRCVPRAAVPRLHAAALQAAREHFAEQRLLVTPARAQQRLDDLLRELESNLAQYVELNTAKLKIVLTNATAAYEDHLQKVKKGQPLCVHPDDLASVHGEAVKAAMTIVDTNCAVGKNEPDAERDAFKQSLASKLQELETLNRQANNTAVGSAMAAYSASMRGALRNGTLGNDALRNAHQAAENKAQETFAKARSLSHKHKHDLYVNDLNQKIEELFADLQTNNRRANRSARQSGLLAYNGHMERETRGAVISPSAFKSAHKGALRQALKEFREERADGTQDDDVEAALVQELDDRFEELYEVNKTQNDNLVDAAFAVYAHFMDSKCTPSLSSILIVPWIIKVLVLLPGYHEEAKEIALQHFRSQRGGSCDDDGYMDSLRDKIAAAYDGYCNPIYALAREFGVPLRN